MKRVLIAGAAGQLGSTVVRRFSERWEVVPFTRAQLDIADMAATVARITAVAPEVIINCAAYNDVDGAEEAAVAALSANAMGVLALSRGATATGATLVHYGTDFVFDGAADRPYTESDPPRPLSVYGTSKLLGEWFALEAPVAYVLRVESLFGGQPAKSSVDKIIAGIRDGRPVRVFSDRTVTPSYVDDVAAATEQMLTTTVAPGIYHCVNSGHGTWLDIAQEAVRLLQHEAELVPVRVDDVKFKARRPRYCALSNEKLAAAGVAMPSWQAALARYINSL
jgi:dTDP-4-dehydrorhamnose reductase